MLLRRITDHVKDQNWLAVWIDFVIVVVGVFIGIQVANWNEARLERELEAQYLARLQQELSEMALQAQSSYEESHDRLKLVQKVKGFFVTGENNEEFVGPECSAIARSHIYAGIIFYPPTIKELISTGRITLIRDSALRTAILAFDKTNEDISQLRTDIQIDRLVLARKHPTLIELDLDSWEGATCDFTEMRESRLFLNDFTDNSFRFRAYTENVLGRQAALIKSLGELVTQSRI